MTADRRSDLYADAMQRTIRPGDVVIDVGAGIGLWSLYACALGATRVIAIEPDPLIAFAADVAVVNGMADRIALLHQPVSEVTLDTPADVVVADLRDVLPFAPTSITGMIDARRLLKPGGTLIPQRDTLWMTVVEADAAYRARSEPWETNRFGVDLSPIRAAALSTPRKERFAAADMVTKPVQWADIDYRTVTAPHVSNDVTMVADRACIAHGFAMWFDAELTDDVLFSNAPDAPPLLYGQAFFPWLQPVALEIGDRIETRVRAIHDGTDYTISFVTRILAADGQSVRARFEQSTFDAVPLVARAMQSSEKV